jgi:hypothetical protein
MRDVLLDIPEIEKRIVIVRANLTESIEQAAGYSGAANEELYSERIAEQDAELKLLLKRRDELLNEGRSRKL